MAGRLFMLPLAILYLGVGAWGFILVSQYVYHEFGMIAVIVGVVVFPLFYSLAPLYAGYADGYWLPAMVCYAPIGLYFVLLIIASIYDGIVGAVSRDRE